MREVWELFQNMEPKQVIADETLFRELKDRFGSPFGFGSTSAAGWAPSGPRPARQVDLDAEREDLEEQVKTAKGQKQSRAVKRLKVVSAFINSDEQARGHGPRGDPGDPAGAMVQLDGGRFATSTSTTSTGA